MKKLIVVSLFVSAFGLAAQAAAASYGPLNNSQTRSDKDVSAAKPGYGDSASCMGSTMSQKLLTNEQKKAMTKEEILALSQTNYGLYVLNSTNPDTPEDHSGKP